MPRRSTSFAPAPRRARRTAPCGRCSTSILGSIAETLAGPVLGSQAATVLRPAVAAVPPDALMVGLGPEGAGFLRAVFTEYLPSESELLLLRLGAQSLDDATAARAADNPKEARAAVRQLLAILQRLGLPSGQKF